MLILFFLVFLFVSLISYGVYNILLEIAKTPNKKYETMFSSFGWSEEKQKLKKQQFTINLATKLAKFINIDDYTKSSIREKLYAVGDNITPEFYIARSIVANWQFIVVAFVGYFINPIITLVCVGIYISQTISTYKYLDVLVEKKKKAIESEIPKFLSYLTQGLVYNKNIIDLFERYKNVAGDILKNELQITIAGMNTGNQEDALLKFSSRINSSDLDKVLKTLINVVKGDNTIEYLKDLSKEMKAKENEILKRRANEIPDKMNKYMTILLFLIVVIALFTMIYSIIINSSQFM